VNLNTASAEVIYAACDGISLADAQRLVAERDNAPLRTWRTRRGCGLPDSRTATVGVDVAASSKCAGGCAWTHVVEERSVVQRDGGEVRPCCASAACSTRRRWRRRRAR
jgi:type II secretory pathway component PulK